MMTIVEIKVHARYHEFAAAVTRSGHQVVPEAFPWNLMGLSDDEIVARPQELLVAGWWRWWQSWEWIANGRAAARATTKLEPIAARPPAGLLF